MTDTNRRLAVVTGAGSGIGAAIAVKLAADGHHVVVADLDADAARAVAAGFGGEAVELDVADPEAVAAVGAAVSERHGRLDVWVSNAGTSRMKPFLEITPADLRRILAVNLEGVFYGGQAAARAMIEHGTGGAIINMASMAGRRGAAKYEAPYVASKHAVIGLTQTMAAEFGPHEITVNAVNPGYVGTSMQAKELRWIAELEGTTEQQVLASFVAETPLGRLQTPEEIAGLVAFLAGPAARSITGAAYDINGGAHMY